MLLNEALSVLVEEVKVCRRKAHKSMKRLFENIQSTYSKIDIFLHPVNQTKHLNKTSLLRAVSTKVHKFIYFSKEKLAGVRVTISWRNADAQ